MPLAKEGSGEGGGEGSEMREGQNKRKREEEFWDKNREKRIYIKTEVSRKMSLVNHFQIIIQT